MRPLLGQHRQLDANTNQQKGVTRLEVGLAELADCFEVLQTPTVLLLEPIDTVLSASRANPAPPHSPQRSRPA